MARTSGDKKYIRDTIQNVQTNEITISEDKLRIKLEKQIKRVKRGCGSLGYLGVAVTCIGVLVSADLKEVFGITPDMWKAVFFIATVVFIVLFFISAFNAIFNRATVDSIVKDIKTADVIESNLGFWNRFKKKHDIDNDNESEEEKK